MNLFKTFLSIALAASIGNSATINISGAIVDSSGKGITGANIRLEKAKLSTISDENGIFTLIGTVGIMPPRKNTSPASGYEPVAIQNGKLTLTLAVQEVVEVAVYGIQGRLIFGIKKQMGAGSHVLALPAAGDGLYLCRIRTGNNEYFVKGTSLRRSSGGALQTAKVQSQKPVAKQAAVTGAMEDMLSVVKEGFQDNRTLVLQSTIEKLAITMITKAGNLTDIDGIVYQTVRIGNQVWMAENLRVTRYNDGSAIPLDTSQKTWFDAITPKYCYYGNTMDKDSIKKYGTLYNWYVVSPANPKKIAPAGWHVPSDAEWTIFEKHLVLNGYNWDGTTDTAQQNKIAKSLAANTDWFTGFSATKGAVGYDLTLNNSSGFSAHQAGYRYASGGFVQRVTCAWWSATENDTLAAWSRKLSYDTHSLYRSGSFDSYKSAGFSVRLVRD